MKNNLINFIKNLISLALTQESGNTVSGSLFKFKNKHKWIYELTFGTATDDEVFNNILKRLKGKFDILMIHSSLNGMLPMYKGNLIKLLDMLISYSKQNNFTLVMPAFLLGTNYQVKKHYENGKNVFDVRKTFSEMGMLSELFRISPEVKRSIHPSHSICAIGPLADQLVNNHHLAPTTFGEGTPFDVMSKHKTLILGIGTRSDLALTQIHAVEDILKNDYPIPLYTDIIPVTCYDESGNTLIYNFRVKNPDYTFDSKSFYKILNRIKVKSWRYKGIPFFLTEAADVTNTFVDAAKKGETMYKKRSTR